jgi:hypothetical protein
MGNLLHRHRQATQSLEDANSAERQPCLFDDRSLPPVAVVDYQGGHRPPNLINQIST